MGVPERAFFPGRPPIDAYGNGGFRFAGMSHKGSLLLLPSGVLAWRVGSAEELGIASFEQVLAERSTIAFLLLGTGRSLRRPSKEVRDAFASAGVGLEAMDTGAAVRTYNILLDEGRPVATALIAVDEPG